MQSCKCFFFCFFLQGPLEKSLQNSVAFERQKNMDNRVGIIRGSVQVTQTPSIQDGENTKLNFIDEFYTKKCVSSWWTRLWNTSRTCKMTLISATRPCSLEVSHFTSCKNKKSFTILEFLFHTTVFVVVSESTDRNSDVMKQEVTRLQEMLNRLDFKRKVRTCKALKRNKNICRCTNKKIHSQCVDQP